MTDGVLAQPLAKLLELGKPGYAREFIWPDYRSFGIGEDHIPALIAIATDHSLIDLTDENDPQAWAPVHAWRALGELRAQEAIFPLMQLFHEVSDNDWVIEEMPDVFAMVGPRAFQPLADYLFNPAYPVHSRLVAATSLMQMALGHPQVRDQSISVLAEQLANYKENSPGMNGVLIANLVELDAVEQAGLIQKVFAKGKVDRFIVGDWRDIKKRLHRNGEPGADFPPPELAKRLDLSPPDPAPRPASQEPHTQPRRPHGTV